MSSRAEKKEATRRKLLQAAARRMKVHGIEGTSVQAVMADAGLTHGSFYAYFEDKNHMVADALLAAMNLSHERVAAQLSPELRGRDRLRAFLDFYLSPGHRSAVADGCPVASLSRDFSQSGPALRHVFARGLLETIDHRRRLFSFGGKVISREEWMGLMACYVGALILSRACEGDPLSDQFLHAGRALLDRTIHPGAKP